MRLGANRRYNQVYKLGPLILQVTNEAFQDHTIQLTPSVTLAIKGEKLTFGVGLEWVTGSINFGWMNANFRRQEEEREKTVAEQAAKEGLTKRQFLRQFGW
jgi:hypothetical protein